MAIEFRRSEGRTQRLLILEKLVEYFPNGVHVKRALASTSIALVANGKHANSVILFDHGP